MQRLVPLVIATALLLGACGGGDEDGEADAATTAKNAALDYSKCMRENGVPDFPDPQFDGSGRTSLEVRRGSATDEAAMEKADEVCAKEREKAMPNVKPDSAEAKEMKEAALAHAKCMRKQGIDFPDPVFEDGGAKVLQTMKDIDPDDPDFKAAEEQCGDLMPRAGLATTSGGGK